MKKIILLIVVTLLAVICYAQSQGAKTVVLEKNEGETRVRRPLGSLPTPSEAFILKVTPQNSGSKHLVLGTEEIPPGGVIPRHKRCGSVPAGQSAPPINTEELKACAHKGHVEFEAFAPPAKQ